MDSSGDDFEDDPFSYQPLKRRKLINNQSQAANLKSDKKAGTKKLKDLSESKQIKTDVSPNNSIIKRKVSLSKEPEKKNVKNKNIKSKATPKTVKTLDDLLTSESSLRLKQTFTNTECPVCQLPLHLLSDIITSTNHLAECAENLDRLLPPCPDGIYCDSKVVVHYATFDHLLLAKHRDLGLINQTTKNISRGPVLDLTDETPVPRFSSTRIHPDQTVTSDVSFQGVSKAKYVSPVKVIRRTSKKDDSFKCHMCGKSCNDENDIIQHVCPTTICAKTPSITKSKRESPQVQTEHQRRFLRELALDDHGERNWSVNSSSVLFKNKEARTRNWVQSATGDFCNRDENVASKDLIEEVPGPSGLNNNDHLHKTNREKVLVDGREFDISLEPSLHEQSNEDCNLVDASPIKVVAEKDSQELELSLNIDPSVHCTKLRLCVPLKKSETGDELPVRVSADYNEIPSPSKQPQIKDYFKSSTNSTAMNDSASNLGVVHLSKAKEEWKKIFSRAKAKGFLAPAESENVRKEDQEKVSKPTCPWYKKIKDTSLAVDAFKYGNVPGIKYYLLTHFHYDHYGGLSKRWTMPIISSTITKRLATKFVYAKESLFITLDPGESRIVGGCELTAVDANHCPGSIMFVIRLSSGETLLHVGDFRACQKMEEEPIFWNTKIDRIYLDTTYCKPEYDFPSQSDVISRTAEVVSNFVLSMPNTIVMVGAYTVGKERIFKQIAHVLNSKVWGDSKRVKTWRTIGDDEILERLVSDRNTAQVQVIMNHCISWPKLGEELNKLGGRWNHVLGVKPTGWTHGRGDDKEKSLSAIQIVTRGHISMLEVPYSEHSSYSELKRFIQFLRIDSEKQIVPTVNVQRNKEMSLLFKTWIDERKVRGPDSQ